MNPLIVKSTNESTIDEFKFTLSILMEFFFIIIYFSRCKSSLEMIMEKCLLTCSIRHLAYLIYILKQFYLNLLRKISYPPKSWYLDRKGYYNQQPQIQFEMFPTRAYLNLSNWRQKLICANDSRHAASLVRTPTPVMSARWMVQML